MKNLVLIFALLFLVNCGSDDSKSTKVLPSKIEFSYPSSSLSYFEVVFAYNKDYSIRKITKTNAIDEVTEYNLSYSNNKISQLEIVSPINTKTIDFDYTIEGFLSKITESIDGGSTEYEISYNSTTNIYKYSTSYNWFFDDNDNFSMYLFLSDRQLEVTLDEGKGLFELSGLQPLVIYDSLNGDGIFSSLNYLCNRPISQTVFTDLSTDDVITTNYTNTFDTNGKLVEIEQYATNPSNPNLIVTINYGNF